MCTIAIKVNYIENTHFMIMSISNCYKSKAFLYVPYETFKYKRVEYKLLDFLIDIKCYKDNMKEQEFQIDSIISVFKC